MNGFAADKPMKIVTTTTLFADLVRKIGGKHVKVDSIASPKFNVHFIQPTPNDVRKTAHADLFVFTGLDLEAWADPLLEAAGKIELFRGGARNLDLSQGIVLLKIPTGELSRAGGDLHFFGNPHYALNPENVKIMAGTVARKLKELDPAHADVYENHERELQKKLDLKIAEWKALCPHCVGREVFSYHDDIAYLAYFLGLKENQYLEPKPGVPPAPRHLVFLENYAKENNVRAIIAASYYPQKPMRKLAQKINAKQAIIGQSPGEITQTEDLFDFYEKNINAIAAALS